jgi:hypothetical protein
LNKNSIRNDHRGMQGNKGRILHHIRKGIKYETTKGGGKAARRGYCIIFE